MDGANSSGPTVHVTVTPQRAVALRSRSNHGQSFDKTWQKVVDGRAPGSPVWKPSYGEGALVRVAATDRDLTDQTLTWETDHPIIYLVHPSDQRSSSRSRPRVRRDGGDGVVRDRRPASTPGLGDRSDPQRHRRSPALTVCRREAAHRQRWAT